MPDLFNRRRFLAGSALLAGGAAAMPLLSACDANSGGSGTSDGDKTTLSVMNASNELTKEHIADFEGRNPDIRIQLIEPGNDDAKLNAMLAAGNPPDLVRGAAVGSANNNARGLATSLDPYLDKSTVLKKEDLLAVNDNWRWDGHQVGAGPYYGITKDWSQDATLWYNLALFAQAKVAPLSTTEPVTYDKLLETARKLTVKKDGKTTVYGVGIEWQWGLYGPLCSMILSQAAASTAPTSPAPTSPRRRRGGRCNGSSTWPSPARRPPRSTRSPTGRTCPPSWPSGWRSPRTATGTAETSSRRPRT